VPLAGETFFMRFIYEPYNVLRESSVFVFSLRPSRRESAQPTSRGERTRGRRRASMTALRRRACRSRRRPPGLRVNQWAPWQAPDYRRWRSSRSSWDCGKAGRKFGQLSASLHIGLAHKRDQVEVGLSAARLRDLSTPRVSQLSSRW
jgi:hypothetical protein